MTHHILKFIIGAILGSFFHVIAICMPIKANWFTRRSACPRCARKLKTLELIPILSFLTLKGRCLGCRAKISPIYFWCELISGILFLMAPNTFEASVLVSLMLLVTLTDIYYQVVPNKTLILFGTILWLAGGNFLGGVAGFAIMSAISGIGWLLWRKATLGAGDIKLYFVIGLILPIPALFLSIFFASAFALAYIIITCHPKQTPLPFAPFISIGVYISYLWSAPIISWYLFLI